MRTTLLTSRPVELSFKPSCITLWTDLIEGVQIQKEELEKVQQLDQQGVQDH